MFISKYKLTLSTFALNSAALMFGFFLLKIIVRNTMFYAFTSEKTSEIAYYISFYVCHFGAPGIFQRNNGREFKGALLIFLNKHEIKLMNDRPQTPRIQGLREPTNAVVKNKITRWQSQHGTTSWVESLTEICEAINSQTHESLPAIVTHFS